MLADLRFYIVYLSLLSGICGLSYWYKLPDYKSRLIVVSIWFSALIEIVGKYFTACTGLLNFCVFNLYILLIFSLYIFLLKSLLKNQSYKYLAVFLLLVFVVYFAINSILGDPLKDILVSSYAVGVISIAILSFLYLLEVFSSNLILNYTKSIFFWFILGILILHVPFLPFMLSLDWFLIDYNPSIYELIIFFLNLLMNCCFAAGFIWSERKYNY